MVTFVREVTWFEKNLAIKPRVSSSSTIRQGNHKNKSKCRLISNQHFYINDFPTVTLPWALILGKL